jgi:uncharacterized protein
MTLRSTLYAGAVMHSRLRPTLHKFRYRAFWLLIDLDELSELSARLRLFSHNRFNLFALREEDHGDGSVTSLRAQAERQLAEVGIHIGGGAIRMLCMPRTLGYSFNPITVYFCYRAGGELAAIIYEVHNTFGERHAYVSAVTPKIAEIRQNCRKAFYVSPFMDMDLAYDFRLAEPADHVTVGINVSKRGQHILHARLSGKRRPLTDGELLKLFFSIPLLTAKVTLGIHWEALRLWLKGMRMRKRPAPPVPGTTLVTNTSSHRIDSHVY